MNIQERIKNAPRKQWIKFALMFSVCLFFTFWSGYYAFLIVIPFFFDSYITQYIPWSFWRKSENKLFKSTMSWVDAIVSSLVAVYFVHTFFFQNYQIPTSSLEKSLLVGDFLCVSKYSYGSRSPMTPFSLPLVQHTRPIGGSKSFLDNPQVDYKRFPGGGEVQRGDIVVFNFPAGDTVATNAEAQDYYSLCHENPNGRAGVWSNTGMDYGKIVYRPVDRRENYVKRCIGLPGETLEIKDDVVYIDGKALKQPENAQWMYYVQTDGTQISPKVFAEMGISKEDYQGSSSSIASWGLDSVQLTSMGFSPKNNFGTSFLVPLTAKMIQELKAKQFVLSIIKQKEYSRVLAERPDGSVFKYPYYYPITYDTGWLRHEYGPLWIPKRGSTITFDGNVQYKVATYERCIKNYEGNEFAYRDGKVYINGKQTDSYTFKYDYFFMMGDNRHKSADSRSWGFVPEDHIVGKPLFVWFSLNKDKEGFFSQIRWDRIFKSAKSN